MAKIPFTLKEHLAHPEWKVETVLKEPVTIVKTDLRCEDGNILCYYFDGKEEIAYVTTGSDLFIVTPELELTEFEEHLKQLLDFSVTLGSPYEIDCIKTEAAELLDLARKGFVEQGYVIEKKLFRDAVEKIDDKHKAEMSVEYSLHCKIENGTRHVVMNWNEFQKIAQHFIDCGKAEALKDLPRWEKAIGKERFNERMIVLAGDNDLLCTNYAEEGEYYISFSELEKLPKED